MNQAVLNLISKFSTECIQSSSGNETMHAYFYMNSKIRIALLIIMNDRSFELSAKYTVYECRSIVHGNMMFYQFLFIFSSGISHTRVVQ